MDYQKLARLLPKQPTKWTVGDIELWLQFIGLEQLYPAFKKASIDGSCLPSLTEQDLRMELEIKSSITIKKLMNWISIGLKEYSEFVSKANVESRVPVLTNMQTFVSNKYQLEKPEYLEEKLVLQQQQQFTTLEKPGPANQNNPKKQRVELVIQQIDSPKSVFYSLKEEGGNIGRHSTNQIIILEESVSRQHARIDFNNGQFFIMDVGSTTGTFVKIMSKTPLQEGMIIQMGSSCYRIDQCDLQMLVMTIIEGGQSSYEFGFRTGLKISIGRKNTNEIAFPDDQHLSNSHALIYQQDGVYYLEDLKTTNGTWMRLSPQGKKSQYTLLSNGMIFRLGTALTYICKKTTAEILEKANSNACGVCREVDRDCLYMPCKHNFACMNCGVKCPDCQMCGTKIQSRVKLFRC